MNSFPLPALTFRSVRGVTLFLVLLGILFSSGVSAAQTATPPSSLSAPAVSGIFRTHRLPIPTIPGLAPESAVVNQADIPDMNWESGHRGVDLQARPGDAVLASRGGTVHFAGVVAGTPVVSIMHADGLRTTYEPVIASVKKGEKVRRGQQIGTLANAATLGEHARKGPGLSWGAKLGDQYIDPMTLLGALRVRLYPTELNRQSN